MTEISLARIVEEFIYGDAPLFSALLMVLYSVCLAVSFLTLFLFELKLFFVEFGKLLLIIMSEAWLKLLFDTESDATNFFYFSVYSIGTGIILSSVRKFGFKGTSGAPKMAKHILLVTILFSSS